MDDGEERDATGAVGHDGVVVAVDDGLNAGTALVDLAVDEALLVAFLGVGVQRLAVEDPVFEEVFRRLD